MVDWGCKPDSRSGLLASDQYHWGENLTTDLLHFFDPRAYAHFSENSAPLTGTSYARMGKHEDGGNYSLEKRNGEWNRYSWLKSTRSSISDPTPPSALKPYAPYIASPATDIPRKIKPPQHPARVA